MTYIYNQNDHYDDSERLYNDHAYERVKKNKKSKKYKPTRNFLKENTN